MRKIASFFIIICVFLFSFSYANYITLEASKMNIEIQNINESVDIINLITIEQRYHTDDATGVEHLSELDKESITIIKSISATNIENGVLTYSINDFSPLNSNTEFAFEFVNESGDSKYISLGRNEMYQNSLDFPRADESKLEKNITIDYSSGVVISQDSRVETFSLLYVAYLIYFFPIILFIILIIIKKRKKWRMQNGGY